MTGKKVWYSSVKESADGCRIPISADGRALHSLYGARREAVSFVERLPQDGFVVFVGLGAALHITEFLNQWPSRRCLVVEVDQDAVIQLRGLIGDHDLDSFPGFCGIACGPEELAVLLPEYWLPALDGPVTVAPLRSFTELFPDTWAKLSSVITHTIDCIRSDFSVQAFFGKVWHRNIMANLCNLSAHENAVIPDWRDQRVAVAAAGPGLQVLLEGKIKRGRVSAIEYERLVAVDTALPVLIRHGIKVDAVISIDPQLHSQKHFLSGIPEGCLPVFDLGCNPHLAQQSYKKGIQPLFTIGKHPLASLAGRFSYLPVLESGTGTVTIAAADFVRKCGAVEILFYGADFSCPLALPYIMGTYLDAVFSVNQHRLEPFYTAFTSLVFRDSVVRQIEGDHIVYHSPLLDKYLLGFQAWAEHCGLRLETLDGFRRASTMPVQSRQPLSSEPIKLNPFGSHRFFPFKDFIASATGAWNQELLLAKNRDTPWLYALLPLMAWCIRMGRSDVFELAQAQNARYTTLS